MTAWQVHGSPRTSGLFHIPWINQILVLCAHIGHSFRLHCLVECLDTLLCYAMCREKAGNTDSHCHNHLRAHIQHNELLAPRSCLKRLRVSVLLARICHLLLSLSLILILMSHILQPALPIWVSLAIAVLYRSVSDQDGRIPCLFLICSLIYHLVCPRICLPRSLPTRLKNISPFFTSSSSLFAIFFTSFVSCHLDRFLRLTLSFHLGFLSVIYFSNIN